MKNAYNQGLECDHGEEEGGDDGVSPKDVGHNIYILAHQVSHFISTLFCMFHHSGLVSMASYHIFKFWSFNSFSTCLARFSLKTVSSQNP